MTLRSIPNAAFQAVPEERTGTLRRTQSFGHARMLAMIPSLAARMTCKSRTNLPIAACHRAVVAALLAGLGGCASIPHAQPPAAPAIAAPSAEFIIEAGALDTWNAVGQIIVHVDGVTYDGRSQMLGIYDVESRGERFLIITRALVLAGDQQTPRTQVRMAMRDGTPDRSAAAIDLLGLLQQRLPDELHRIATVKTAAPASSRKPRRTRR
jgi:hypothetical protein